MAHKECAANEEYLICGSACPFNCTDPEGPVVCEEDCVEGCFCKNGFLRDVNGSCVPADQCVGEPSICSPNEEFLSCGSACPLTCAQPERAPCGLACSVGCFCKAGYVRDEKSNKCVTLDQCPVEQCLNSNETYAICTASCQPTCSDPEPLCLQVCSSGCVCNEGLLRDDSGVCVRAEQCPPSNSTDAGLVGKYYDVINKILHLSTA
ncbi:hypothetical protein JYU34_001417, partial [Plutella xylostella]